MLVTAVMPVTLRKTLSALRMRKGSWARASLAPVMSGAGCIRGVPSRLHASGKVRKARPLNGNRIPPGAFLS